MFSALYKAVAIPAILRHACKQASLDRDWQLMKMVRLITCAAIAALVTTSAIAADDGGAADLEHRIAQLETAAAARGGRKVSLQISGFIRQQVMWWDDGHQRDIYIGDAIAHISQYRLRGEARTSGDVRAGFDYWFAKRNNSVGVANQLNGGDDLGGSGAPDLREASVWLGHKQVGMLKIGFGSTATDNLNLIDVAGLYGTSSPEIGYLVGGFLLRHADGTLANLRWLSMAHDGREYWDTTWRNNILYETPTLAGFSVQAAVAEDNFWDVALRYASEGAGFRAAGGIGYRENTEFNMGSPECFSQCDRKDWALFGSGSIAHMDTGLFLNAAAGVREHKGFWSNIGAVDNRSADSTFFYLAAGLSKNWFGPGRTVLFVDFSKHSNAMRHQFADVMGSQATQWGAGIVQHIDAAALEVFVSYKNFDAEVERNVGALGAPIAETVKYSPFQTVIIGTTIHF